MFRLLGFDACVAVFKGRRRRRSSCAAPDPNFNMQTTAFAHQMTQNPSGTYARSLQMSELAGRKMRMFWAITRNFFLERGEIMRRRRQCSSARLGRGRGM